MRHLCSLVLLLGFYGAFHFVAGESCSEICWDGDTYYLCCQTPTSSSSSFNGMPKFVLYPMIAVGAIIIVAFILIVCKRCQNCTQTQRESTCRVAVNPQQTNWSQATQPQANWPQTHWPTASMVSPNSQNLQQHQQLHVNLPYPVQPVAPLTAVQPQHATVHPSSGEDQPPPYDVAVSCTPYSKEVR